MKRDIFFLKVENDVEREWKEKLMKIECDGRIWWLNHIQEKIRTILYCLGSILDHIDSKSDKRCEEGWCDCRWHWFGRWDYCGYDCRCRQWWCSWLWRICQEGWHPGDANTCHFQGVFRLENRWLFSVALGRIWRNIIGTEVQEFWVDTLNIFEQFVEYGNRMKQ